MNNKQINCWVSEETLRLIEERAKQHNMKTSAYGSLILNNWTRNQDSQTPIESELKELRDLIKKSGLIKKSKG
jgi:hypothetical protein